MEIAKEVAVATVQDTARETIHSFDLSFERGADLAWEINETGQPVAVGVNSNFKLNPNPLPDAANSHPELPTLFRRMPNGAELWRYGGKYFLGGRAKAGN